MPIEHVFGDRLPDGPPAPVPALGLLPASVQARIVGWWPKGVEDTPAARDIVEACRVVVAAARPRDAKQATSVLSTVRTFLVWLVATEPGVDLAGSTALLTPERLAAYLTDPAGLAERPKGSADASLSFLRRIGPGGPGLTPAPAAEEEEPQVEGPAEAELEVLGLDGPVDTAGSPAEPGAVGVAGLPHGVGAVLATYVPTSLPADRWGRVAEFCRTSVAASAPQQAGHTRSAIRSVAYLAAWVDAAQRPLRTDVVFAPGTIAEFVEVLAARMNPGTAASHRKNVVRVGSAVLGIEYPALPLLPRQKPAGPADDDALEGALRWAGSRRSAKGSRYSTALVVLAAGCGLDATDSAWVAPDDAVEIAAGLGVEVRRPDADGVVRLRRTTFVLPEYVDQLRLIVAEAVDAGDTFLLGGGGVRERRVETLRRGDRDELDLTGLRYRWMLEVLDRGLLPLETFLAAAGLETLRVVSDLLDGRPTPPVALAPLARTGESS